MQKVTFKSTPEGNAFFEETRTAVNDYFRKNNISPLANTEMFAKIIFWLLVWGFSWWGVIQFKDDFWTAFSLGMVHMFTHLMIAFNMMHDSGHDAVFSSKRANKYFTYLLDLVGVNSKIWTISHNLEHHTYINVHGQDGNIDGFKILRFTPDDPLIGIHRFQWLYAPFVYGLVTLNYATIKDFTLMLKYVKKGRLVVTPSWLFEFLFFKALYFTYTFLVPVLVFGVSFKLVLAYWLAGHFMVGVMLALIFVTGHLTENVSFPKVEKNVVQSNWAVNVVSTTGDYSPHSGLEWLVGGINLHVAHHLFPRICHVHYKKISPIIKATAQKHGYVYREIPTFWGAMRSHFALLKALGRPDFK